MKPHGVTLIPKRPFLYTWHHTLSNSPPASTAPAASHFRPAARVAVTWHQCDLQTQAFMAHEGLHPLAAIKATQTELGPGQEDQPWLSSEADSWLKVLEQKSRRFRGDPRPEEPAQRRPGFAQTRAPAPHTPPLTGRRGFLQRSTEPSLERGALHRGPGDAGGLPRTAPPRPWARLCLACCRPRWSAQKIRHHLNIFLPETHLRVSAQNGSLRR